MPRRGRAQREAGTRSLRALNVKNVCGLSLCLALCRALCAVRAV